MIVIMRLLFYNILILIFLPVAVGRILYKSIKDKDYRLNLSQRFGIYKVNSSKKQVIWFHAVSLGEVIASEKIVNKLLKDTDVILTVTTPTGLRHARKIYGDNLKIYYAPWDNLVFMNRAINSFMPSVIVIFETEIWPSMIHCSFKKDIPIILCNGRMSQRSFKSYSRFKALVNKTLQKFSFIFVQSENQAKRFFELGANIEQLQIASSVKFDSHEPNEELGNRVNEPEKDKILA
jgi:3-deoxy-D-manno-octulosonic-acid transferase